MRLHIEAQSKHSVIMITKRLKKMSVKISINISSVILKRLLCMNRIEQQTPEIV